MTTCYNYNYNKSPQKLWAMFMLLFLLTREKVEGRTEVETPSVPQPCTECGLTEC